MLRYITNCLTIYTTSRQVQFKSTILAVTYLFLVVIVWGAYLGSLRLNVRNVYQKACPVQGAIVSKVKGVLSTEDVKASEFQVPYPEIYQRIWDMSDIIFSPNSGDGQDGSFIAVTNILITPNQTIGLCAESNKSNIAKCTDDRDCLKGLSISSTSSGVFTGKCKKETGTCEVSAWCPVEQDVLPVKANRALLEGVQDFTIMLKNSVEFPECGKDLRYRNILENATKDYLSKCLYNINGDKLCPIFRLGDIIAWSGSNFSDVALMGGVFQIEVRWDCDFDWGFTNNFCFPSYHFERIDDPNATNSPGWNFRTSLYHEETRRTLQKIYALKMIVLVSGKGKKCDFPQLILALGSTIALFLVAPLVCDYLFEFLCYLKKFKPCEKHFGKFSVKSRYEDSETYRATSTPNNELATTNNIADENVG